MAKSNHPFIEEGKKNGAVFKQCLPFINKYFKWEELEAIHKHVRNTFIRECLGADLYDEILAIQEIAPDKRTECQCAILEDLRIAVSHFMAYSMWDKISVYISELGISQAANDDKRQVADDRASMRAKYGYLDCAWDAMEELWRRLIECKQEFQAWFGSVPQKLTCSLVLSMPWEFAAYQNISSPGRMGHWKKLIPHLTEIQKDIVEPCLCPDLLKVILKNQCNCVEGCEEMEVLRECVQRFMATAALKRALRFSNVMFTADGFKFINNRASNSSFRGSNKLISADMDRMRNDLQTDCDKQLEHVKCYLRDNIDSECLKEFKDCVFPPVEVVEEEHSDCNCGSGCGCGKQCGCGCACKKKKDNCVSSSGATTILGMI